MNDRSVSKSKIESLITAMPKHTNTLGSYFGGELVCEIDKFASITAIRHCRKKVVTASIDTTFINPIKIGYFILLSAQIGFTGKTSIIVDVKVRAEEPLSGKIIDVCYGNITFVAINSEGQPSDVPPIVPESEEELMNYKKHEKIYILKKSEGIIQK